MGCDIHSFAEVRRDGKWEVVGKVFPETSDYMRETYGPMTSEPFGWRSYGMFGFLANVRNYSHAPVIAEPKYALPDDVSDEVRDAYGDGDDYHTTTWLTLRQLQEFNYDQVMWDRRVTKQVAPNYWDGAALAEEGEGEHLTVRKFLHQHFFEHLKALSQLGEPDDVRIVFWFDN